MPKCPYCGKDWVEGRTECQFCGHQLVAEPTLIMQKEEREVKQPSRNKVPPKKITIIVSLILVFLIFVGCLGVAIFLLVGNRDKARLEKDIQSIWHEVISTSEVMVHSAEEGDSYDKLNELQKDVSSQRDIVKENIGKTKALLSDREDTDDLQKLNKAILDYDEFLEELEDFLNQAKDVDINKGLKTLNKKAEAANDSAQKLINTVDYIKRNFDQDVFDIPDTVADIIAQHRTKEAKRQKEETEKQEEEQEKLDEKAVEEIVINFMIAFRDRDELKMKILMTKAAKDRFNPEDEFEGNYYIRDFEVMTKEHISQLQFQVRVREYDEEIISESETESFTTDRLFIIVKSDQKWLIDEWGVIE